MGCEETEDRVWWWRKAWRALHRTDYNVTVLLASQQELHKKLNTLLTRTDVLTGAVCALTLKGDQHMASILESFQALSAEVDTIVTDLAALKEQIAAGSPVTAEQIDALTAKLKAAE